MSILKKPLVLCIVAVFALVAVANATQVIIPAYFYPGALWTLSASGGSKASVMVANPNNGPGSKVDANYKSAITAAQSKGVRVVGYVHLSYGTRDPNAVKADIAAWYSMYPSVDGIFFDECPATATGVSYVSAMQKVVKSHAKNLLVLNPGVYPVQSYMNLGDILLVFEDSYSRYVSTSVPSWVTNYSSSKFYHVVHTTTSAQYANALALAKQRRAGYVYITNDVMPNPYDTLPTYWSTELAAMSTATSVQEDDAVDVLTDGVLADQENAEIEAAAALAASVQQEMIAQGVVTNEDGSPAAPLTDPGVSN